MNIVNDVKTQMVDKLFNLTDRNCRICSRTFKTTSGLEQHIKNYHDMTVEQYNDQFSKERADEYKQILDVASTVTDKKEE